MAKENETPKKFKPERPIYLNEENTGFKTRDQVLKAIEDLREKGWLAAYGEKSRPLHMSFNDEKELQEFKKCAGDLKITLKSKVIHDEDLQDFDDEDKKLAELTAKESYEDVHGKTHISK